MTAAEFFRLRKRLGLSSWQMGMALGLTGTRLAIKSFVHKRETGKVPITAEWAAKIEAVAREREEA